MLSHGALLKSRVVMVGVLIPCLLLLNSCALMMNGTQQGIPVHTQPVGVAVYLDGEYVGVTPLELQVSRGQSHELVLKFGEQEKLIKLEPEVAAEGTTGLLLDAVPLAGFSAFALINSSSAHCEGYESACGQIGTVVLVAGAGISGLLVGIDAVTGAIYTLNPGEVNAVFEEVNP